MNLSELNNLELDNIGSWPPAAKLMAIAAICITILIAGYFLIISNQVATLKIVEAKEVELKQLFEMKQRKASNLASYQQQMNDIETTFGTLLKQLPGETEVAGLLTDISETGLSSGLEFELFKPQTELPIDFYAELPINIRVKGTYHEFGKFISSIANLPRIVTLHNFTIEPDRNKPQILRMEATAKTYRYIEGQSVAGGVK